MFSYNFGTNLAVEGSERVESLRTSFLLSQFGCAHIILSGGSVSAVSSSPAPRAGSLKIILLFAFDSPPVPWSYLKEHSRAIAPRDQGRAIKMLLEELFFGESSLQSK